MAILTVNGAAAPAPSAMAVALFDAVSGARYNAAGNAVIDRIAVKRRLELRWAYISGTELAVLLEKIGGFFQAGYPDPQSGEMRSMTCYCSDRVAGVLRMADGGPIWTDVKMTWTER